MGVGTQDVFGSSKHSPQSQLSETFNAKLRTGWRNARKTTYETSAGEKCINKMDILHKIQPLFPFLNFCFYSDFSPTIS
jgi:hypothetical protein